MIKIWMLFILAGLAGGAEKVSDADRREMAALKEKIISLKSEVQRLGTEISRTDSLRKEENRRSEKLKKNFEKERENRDKEFSDLKARLAALDGEIQAEKKKKSIAENQTADLVSREKSVAPVLESQCATFSQAIEKTIPWDLDARLNRVRNLCQDLKSSLSTEDGFRRLKSLYDEEIRFGDEVALYNKPFTRNSGDVINAQILRFGNQGMFYMDDEAKLFGVLIRISGGDSISYQWREELTFAERNSVREAIEVKQAKKAPKLIQLPMGLSVQGASE